MLQLLQLDFFESHLRLQSRDRVKVLGLRLPPRPEFLLERLDIRLEGLDLLIFGLEQSFEFIFLLFMLEQLF